MKVRKVFSAFLACMTIITFGLSVSAEGVSSSEPIQLYYLIASRAESLLSINGTSAICESICIRDTSIKKIIAVQTLEKHWGLWMWDPVANASWTKTISSANLSMSNTKSGLVGGTYRLKTEFTLTTSNGQTETVTVYSWEVTI